MRSVQLEIGEQYACTLPGKAGAGYLWAYVVEGLSDVVNVAVSNVRPQRAGREGSPPPAGRSTDVQFTITAQVPGDVIIRFQLQSPWETTKPPLDERTLRIIVASHKTG